MFRSLFLTTLILSILASPVLAADISVTATDNSSRPVAGIAVKVVSEKMSWNCITNRDGAFSLANVPANKPFELLFNRKDGTEPVHISGLVFPDHKATLPISIEYGVVSKGDYYSVRLPSNPTTGYSWKVLMVNPESTFKFNSNEYITEQTRPENKIRPGSGGIEKFNFKAIGLGKTNIVLGYLRNREKGISPVSYHICSVMSRTKQNKQIQE